MRAFIAVDIPEDLKKAIGCIGNGLENTGADLKLVKPENLHLTVKFLGDISSGQLEKAKKVMDEMKGSGAFKLQLRGLGYFGNPNFMKVVWVGAGEGTKKIVSLMLFTKLKLADVRKDDFQENSVHLTIARPFSGKNKEKLLEYIEGGKEMEIGEFEVKEVKLMESILQPGGPIYKEVYKVGL